MLLDMIQTQVQNKSFSHLRTIGQHSGQDVRLVSVNGGLCSMHTERVSNDLRHMKSSQLQNLAQVLSQRVMYIESSIKSLAVCMPHMDKQCPYFYSKILSLDASRQNIQCAWFLFCWLDHTCS